MAYSRWLPQTISGKAFATILPFAILLFSLMTWTAYDSARKLAISTAIERLNYDRNLTQQQLSQRFDAVALAERTAASLLVENLLSSGHSTARFNRLFPEHRDGARRRSGQVRTGEGGALSPDNYRAFITGPQISIRRQTSLLAAYDTLQMSADSLPETVDNLFFFSPDNDLLIYAPDRADMLAQYRSIAPEGFDVQAKALSKTPQPAGNTGGTMRCTGLQASVFEANPHSWTTRCMTPVLLAGKQVGVWGSNIPLEKILPLQSGNTKRAITHILVSGSGQLVFHPDYTLQSHAEAGRFLDLHAIQDPALHDLWKVMQDDDDRARSGYIAASDQYYSYAQLPQSGWHMASVSSGADIRREAFLAASPVLIGGVIITAAFTVLLIGFFQHHIAAPLTQLSHRAAGFSADSALDNSHHKTVKNNEISLLNQAFDAMEERVAREQLRMSESFDTMVNAINDYALIMLGPTGQIRQANRASRENFLWDDTKGGGLIQIFGPVHDPHRALQDHLEKVEKTGQVIQTLNRFRGDGSRFWAAEITQVIRDDKGQVEGFAYIARDNSDEKAAESILVSARDDARRAAEMRMNLLATVSHEIRTPMTGILGMLDHMRTDDSARTKAKSLDLIESSSQAMMRVLDDVLQQARLESGTVVIEKRPFSAAEIVRQTAELFIPLAKRRGTKIHTTVSSKSKLLGDPTRIQQVLANFTSNAIKFADKGTITIACHDEPAEEGPAHVWFTVTDDGIGIAPDALERLFEKFEQAEPTTQLKYGGTGLGLSICRDLAQAMGGNVSAESQSGQGSVFTLSLTLDVVEADVTEQPGLGQSALALIPAATARVSAEIALNALGFDTVSAASLVELEPPLRSELAKGSGTFDIILFDDACFKPSQIEDCFGTTYAAALSTLSPEGTNMSVDADILRRMVHGHRNA